MPLDLTSSFEVVDPRFRKLALPHIHVEKLYTGCRWAEGPAWFAAGRYLVWSDIPSDRMLRWDETDGSVCVFRQPSMNSNGNTVDAMGRLVTCEHRTRCVSRTEFDGTRTMLPNRYDGKRFNSPNDVVVKTDDSIWFTDPSYGIDSDYEGDAAPSEIGARNVYRIDAATGRVTVLASDFVQPNGLAFSPDESLLYIVDSGFTHKSTGRATCGDSRCRSTAHRFRAARCSPTVRWASTIVFASTCMAICGSRPATACAAMRRTARC
jgi:gluconolactonase